MPINRCSFNVVDPETKRNRKCKNSKCQISKYCTLHFKFLNIKYILLIQSIFRGNKIRNKLNNIYSKLPDELQRLIISKGREYLFYNKYKKVINNIINKRIYKIIFSNYTYHIISTTYYIIHNKYTIKTNYLHIDLFFQDVSHLCFLLNKYYCIYNNNCESNIDYYKLIRNIIYNNYFIAYNYNITELVIYYDLYSELKYNQKYIFPNLLEN